MPRYILDRESWEITQNGKELELVISGKRTTRKFISPDHATVQYVKLIGEKEAAGWTRTEGSATVVESDEPREPALEQHILADLEDPNGYAVYGDWYQTQQHPRGELIALQLAEETREDKRRLHDASVKHLARYKAELLGPLAQHVSPSGESPFVWRNGFIQGLVFSEDDAAAEITRAVVSHPSGRFLTSLEIQIHESRELRDTLAALEGARETMRELEIRTGTEIRGLAVVERMPRLRSLAIATMADSLEPAELGSLAAIPVSCEALHVQLGGGHAPEGWDELAPLFARSDLDLRELTVRIAAWINKILPAIAEGPLAPRLETLDFAFTRPERGLTTLIANRDRFAKLREVTVSLDRLTFEARSALKGFKKVVDLRTDDLEDRIGYVDEDGDAYDDVHE